MNFSPQQPPGRFADRHFLQRGLPYLAFYFPFLLQDLGSTLPFTTPG